MVLLIEGGRDPLVLWPGPPRLCQQAQPSIIPGQRSGRNHSNKGHHGDLLTRNDPEYVWVLLHDTGGIGSTTSQRSASTLKMERLKKLVIKNNIDLVYLTEVNQDWQMVDHNITIWGSTSSWKENHRLQVSQYNSKPPQDSSHLVGGTVMIKLHCIKALKIWRK